MVQTPKSNYSDEVLLIISTKAMGNFFLHEPMITLQKCRVLAKAIMFPGTLLWLSTKANGEVLRTTLLKVYYKNAGIIGKTIMFPGTLLWPLAKAFGDVLGTTLKEEWRTMVVQ